MIKDILRKDHINTDADASIKGLGLQKIRAVERLLTALLENKIAVFCTIEHIDDVLELDMCAEKPEYITEQNKSYSTTFSLNSEEIKNSLRIFFDNWQGIVESSESIQFVFYTNTTISKEYKVGVLSKMKEDLPTKPLLQLLVEREYDEAFPFVLPILKEYYLKQHSKHTEDISVFERIWDSITIDKWKKFFALIEWNFGERTEQEVLKVVTEKVSQLCIQYDVDQKYVNSIVAQLKDMVESRTSQKDFLQRIVHVGEVKSLFLELAQEAKVLEKLDPMHERWDSINCNDIRDINDKFRGVCPQYNEEHILELEEEYIDGSYEQSQHYDIRQVKAYNYRIYVVCKKLIKKTVENHKTGFTQKQIETIVEELTDEAEKLIQDKAKTYKIAFNDRDMVRKTILILFQECYLALDEGSIVNG
jgi:hypothetical protein